MTPEYLFIRLLEACNANCSMCSFQLSKDRYRLSLQDMKELLPRVQSEGIRYIRFTGGEPLLHSDIVNFIDLITQHGMQSSIITNGYFLEKKIDALTQAGLNQIIVSIDGAKSSTHNEIRGTLGMFERALSGLQEAYYRGLLCRVNTVCGPSNFREMPELQDLLTELQIHQWDLSSLKLERPLDYSKNDLVDIEAVVKYIYHDAIQAGRLVPMGKIWCGETNEERQIYLTTGICPRPDKQCLLVHKVRYLDAKNSYLYPCSLLPHRPNASKCGTSALPPKHFSILNAKILQKVQYFRENGPTSCTGCSSSAASYSNQLLSNASLPSWSV